MWQAAASTNEPAVTLNAGAAPEGGNALPGFTYPLGQLFAGM